MDLDLFLIPKGSKIIGTTASYLLGVPLDLNVAIDQRVYDMWKQLPGRDESLKWVFPRALVARDDPLYDEPVYLDNSPARYFSSSGAAAIWLADRLGCHPIYLLGFDMGEGRWHDNYPRDWDDVSSPYEKFRLEIEESIARQVRANVYNCSPNSSLTCFPHLPFRLAVRVKTEKLTENEG